MGRYKPKDRKNISNRVFDRYAFRSGQMHSIHGMANFQVDTQESQFFGLYSNTGQGANELFGMNQNVATDSTVTFAGITLGKPSRSGGNFGSTINVEGQSFFMTIANIPVLPGKGEEIASKKSTIPTLIQNTSCLTTSVILVTCASALLSVTAFRVTEGSFQISISNESISVFEEGSAVFNFTIF